MKKIHIIELVQDFLASEMPEDMISQYHPEIIRSYLNMAYNQAVYLTWLNGKKFSDYSQLDAWTKTYRRELVNGALAGTTTVSGNVRLPFPPVQLPNNLGIRQVSMYTDESVVFAYLENTAVAIFEELEVFSIDPTPYFRLEQNDTGSGIESHVLKLGKIPVSFYLDPNPTYINVKMIVPFDQMDDYDDIAIPAGQEDMLVKQTIELMTKKAPEDTNNDMNAQRTS